MNKQKSKINKLIIEHSYLPTLKDKNKIRCSEYIFTELKKREPYVDFETEVLPNLSEKQAFIFSHYMVEDYGYTQIGLAKKLKYSEVDGIIPNAIDNILNKIDKIIRLKKERKMFVEKYGGEQALEDIALCLTDNDRNVLNNVILSINPIAYTKQIEERGYHFNRESVIKNLDEIVQRKKDCQKFIKKYGGEDFLIYEFGSTLDDDEFFILSQILMDYHYISQNNASKEYSGYRNFILLGIRGIMKKLNDYLARKKEVDALIERAGGAERVLSEIYLNLNNFQKKIFEERILAYKQTSREEIGKKFNFSDTTVKVQELKLLQKLEDLAQSGLEAENKN